MRFSLFYRVLWQNKLLIGKLLLVFLFMPQLALAQLPDTALAAPAVLLLPMAVRLTPRVSNPAKLDLPTLVSTSTGNNFIVNTPIPIKPFSYADFNLSGNLLPKMGVPVTFIAFGLAGLGKKPLMDYNHEVNEEVEEHFSGFHTTLDNYTRHLPIAAVYGLNLTGVKGKHDLVNLTILYGLTGLLNKTITDNTKKLSAEVRPDHSTADGFPSGHTSAAFAKATILYLEYKDHSIWYGVGGYAVASATGAMRMLNHRHWLSDVLAGAGVGILSTQVVYAVYPWLQQKISRVMPQGLQSKLMIMPAYTNKNAGVSLFYNLENPRTLR